MMSEKSSSSGGGIGFCGMLTILFIGLKLTGHITWSWLWVLSPIWLTALAAVLIVVVISMIMER
jgi:hypothetical protein